MFIVVKGNKKPRHRRGNGLYSKTEREGFEPSKPCGLQVFETCCFNHSHTSPIIPSPSGGHRVSNSIIANFCALLRRILLITYAKIVLLPPAPRQIRRVRPPGTKNAFRGR